ncbi:Rieske 2Fe-2S domain-containing protein [Halarchaeum sp. CBA1220]|uniref:Rieske (2Fe-2S) protein n=1 Tax=Halarchaeum sp. CBA1220 TaxID=1853682 RepID=UPI000F3A82E0|nr:Rieske 2Fe-2S domain-containing protein [Halarchaeum sp. CBA1220]QLC33896.1 Rieske 2Fe-2S domain-containing protein [Halarchaeum sp. CBA1220]
MDSGTRMAPLADVPDESSLLVTLRDDAGEDVEFVLVRADGGDSEGAEEEVRAWHNICPHWTDVRFDSGSGAEVRNGDLVCTKHGATFACESGDCDFGPPEGASLTGVDVAVRDGSVYLVDDDYEFVRVGAAEVGRDRSTNPGERLGF